jgi:hypothetical protein
MKNVQFKVQGHKLIITVDLNEEHGPSKSGKTIVIASTEGNVPLPGAAEDDDTVRIGLNVYKYPA